MTLTDFALPERPADRRYWGQAIGAAGACAIADIARQHQGLTLIITSNTENADRLQRELRFFLNAELQSKTTELLHFPDWETLPYDSFSPHRDIISRRLKTLFRLPGIKQSILIAPVTTLLHRLPPRQWLQGNSLMIAKGDRFDREQYRLDLEAAGYTHVDTVLTHGEYALRGSILDIFPMGSEHPYRIDLFDDEVDTLKTFDPDTQRSLEDIDSIQLLPAHEFPLNKEARDRFRSAYRDAFDVDYRECPMYTDIGKGIPSPGMEYFLDLFFDQTESLFEHLPRKTLVVTDGNTQEAVQQFIAEAGSRYENHRVNPQRPLLEPSRVFLNENEFFGQLLEYPRITLTQELQPTKAGKENLALQKGPE